MTKTLDEIQKEFETLLSNNKNEIAAVTEKLEMKKNEMTALQSQLKKAEKDINLDKFEKVNKEIWVVEQTIKMLTKKLQQLKNEPIITKEQFIKYEDEIQKSFQLERKEPRKDFEKLKPTLEKMIVKEMESRVKGQKLLYELVKTLIKDNREYFRMENGAYSSFASSLQNDNTTLRYEVEGFAKNVLD
jgi:septal ring factor EnvC (AmiA/AmiB activator)